jgi:DNA-binding transcriptional LysR family regulator
MSVDLFAKGLSLERLETLLKVHDAGSIVNAAPGEPIRQSQYSRQIKDLATFFGCALLEARGRGRVLTPAGVRLVGIARGMRDALGDFKNAASEEPIAFALGAGDSLLHWWVIPRLARARAKLADARVELVSLAARDIVERVRDARLDFGVVRETEVPSDLKTRALGPFRFALYVPRALRKRRTKSMTPMTPEEILALPFALQQSEPQLNAALEAYASKHRKVLRVALACETFPQAWRAVQSGAYASLLPKLAHGEPGLHEMDAVWPKGMEATASNIVLAWHMRMEDVRPTLAELVGPLAAALRG